MKPLSLLILVLALVGAPEGVANAAQAPVDRGARLGLRTEQSGLRVRPVPEPASLGSAVIGGTATWFCGGGSRCTRGYDAYDLIAAVDPGLGIPRGTLLTVTHGSRSVLVRAVDVCACSGRRIVDLSRLAFSRLASPSAGVIAVTITVGAILPPTDMEEAP